MIQDYLIILLILLFIIYLCRKKFKNTIEDFSNDYILPKTVYAFWDNYKENKIIQAHMDNWKKKLTGWKIIMIDKNNIHDYVEQDFIRKYASGTIDSTRFSDFLRIHLLQNNGGCWLDASILISDGDFLDDIYVEMIKNKYDACFYEYKEQTVDKTQPHIDNWFMMAPKGSKIITDLYKEFNRAFEMGFLQYKQTILIPSKINLINTLGYEENTYLMQHAIFHYLFKIGNKYNILLKDASESMYKIQTLFNWNTEATIKFILDNNVWDNIYAIKLTKADRAAITNKKAYIKKLESL